MQVHEIAERGGVAPHVVRYYTRLGLLQPRRDAANGYRVYAATDLRRLHFIRQAQTLGCTLAEITDILNHAAAGESPCPRVREIVERRLHETRARIDALQALAARMETALARWSALPDAVPDGHTVCRLIESLEDGVDLYPAHRP